VNQRSLRPPLSEDPQYIVQRLRHDDPADRAIAGRSAVRLALFASGRHVSYF
jgi:hypothetical protein